MSIFTLDMLGLLLLLLSLVSMVLSNITLLTLAGFSALHKVPVSLVTEHGVSQLNKSS